MLQPFLDDLDRLLQHTPDLWAGLRHARIFLTGGTGFFGKWLLESFLFANRHHQLHARLTILTRFPDAFKHAMPNRADSFSVDLVEGDIRSFSFPSARFTHVIHAATPTVHSPGDAELQEIIVKGTERVLAFAEQAGRPDLLYISSGAAYGKQPADVTHIDEDFAGAPYVAHSVYGDSKRAAEQLCLACGQEHDLKVTIARGFAFVGPYLPLDAHFAIGNFIRDGLAGGPIRVHGDGTPYRSYLYAADLAGWLWTLLLRGARGETYNVGSDDDLTIAELAGKIAAYFGTQVERTRAAEPGQPAQRYVPSIMAARAELGLDVWTPLDDAIERTVRWHRLIRNENFESTR